MASNAETVFIWWRHREEWRDGDCAVISIVLPSLISLWQVIVCPSWYHTLCWFTLSLDVWILFQVINCHCLNFNGAIDVKYYDDTREPLWCVFCSHYVSLSGLFMWDSSLLWRCCATLLSKFSNNNCLHNTVCLRMILLLPGPPSEKFTVFFYHAPPFMTWVLSTNHMSRLFFR